MDSEALKATWRQIVRLYPAATLPIDFFISPGSWRMWGVDLLRGPFEDGKTRKVAALIAQLPSEAVDQLSRLARINAQRANGIFNAVGVTYVTLPLAIGALLSDAAPEVVRAYVLENVWFLVRLTVLLAVTPIVYFLGMWRARQISWTLDLLQAGVAPKTRA